MRLMDAIWKTRFMAAVFENAQVTSWWGRVFEELVDAASGPSGSDEPTTLSDALDVGCGEGMGSRVLAKRVPRIVGVDISAHMVRRARRHADRAGLANTEYREADACRLPFPDQSFDLVTSTSLVYLLPDPAGVLRELGRVCRAGGRVASFDPARGLTLRRAATAIAGGEVEGRASTRAAFFLIGWVGVSLLHRRFSREEVLGLMAVAGLEPVLVETRCRGMVLFSVGTPARTTPTVANRQ